MTTSGSDEKFRSPQVRSAAPVVLQNLPVVGEVVVQQLASSFPDEEDLDDADKHLQDHAGVFAFPTYSALVST